MQALADEAEVIYMVSSSDDNGNLADENINEAEGEEVEDLGDFFNTRQSSKSTSPPAKLKVVPKRAEI